MHLILIDLYPRFTLKTRAEIKLQIRLLRFKKRYRSIGTTDQIVLYHLFSSKTHSKSNLWCFNEGTDHDDLYPVFHDISWSIRPIWSVPSFSSLFQGTDQLQISKYFQRFHYQDPENKATMRYRSIWSVPSSNDLSLILPLESFKDQFDLYPCFSWNSWSVRFSWFHHNSTTQ